MITIAHQLTVVLLKENRLSKLEDIRRSYMKTKNDGFL